MIKLFTKHPNSSGKGFLEHGLFAVKIAMRLIAKGLLFLVHAALPFIRIPYSLNLESTALFLFEKNNELED